MTVLVHFQTRSAYRASMRTNFERARAAFLARVPDVSPDIANKHAERAAEHQALQPPHRYNDVAAFIEVIYDGSRTIKSYAYEAQPRKRSRYEPAKTPRRDTKDRIYVELEKVSETWFALDPGTDDFKDALHHTGKQLRHWARRNRWSLEFDQALVACTDWVKYVSLAQQSGTA